MYALCSTKLLMLQWVGSMLQRVATAQLFVCAVVSPCFWSAECNAAPQCQQLAVFKLHLCKRNFLHIQNMWLTPHFALQPLRCKCHALKIMLNRLVVCRRVRLRQKKSPAVKGLPWKQQLHLQPSLPWWRD